MDAIRKAVAGTLRYISRWCRPTTGTDLSQVADHIDHATDADNGCEHCNLCCPMCHTIPCDPDCPLYDTAPQTRF